MNLGLESFSSGLSSLASICESFEAGSGSFGSRSFGRSFGCAKTRFVSSRGFSPGLDLFFVTKQFNT